MRKAGMGHGYQYDHDFEHAFSGPEFMLRGLDGSRHPRGCCPAERGTEREVLKGMRFCDDKCAIRLAARSAETGDVPG